MLPTKRPALQRARSRPKGLLARQAQWRFARLERDLKRINAAPEMAELQRVVLLLVRMQRELRCIRRG